MDHSDYPQSDSSENIPSNNIPSNYPQSNETPPSNNQIYTNHPIPQRTIGKFVEIHGKSIQEYVLARQEPGPTDDERDIFNRSKYRKYFINYNNYDKKILKENDCYILMESDQISDNISSRKSFIMRRADQSPVPTNEKKLKDEIAKIASIDSNTIARFRGFSLYDPDGNKMPTLITDRPKNGPLYNYVINTSHPLQDHQIYTIILGIASGLEKLHTIGIVHGHLNLTNIYLDEHMHPYICDYGFIDSNSSRGIPERDLYFTNVAYYAPEVINKWEFSPAADVFSLGMIMFSLFANSLPYPGIYANTQFIKNSKGDFPCFPSTIKQPYKSLIEECWRINPASRPEVKNILSLLLNKEEYFLSQLNEVANYKLSIANEHDDSEPIIHIESNFIEDITKIPQELRSVISMAEKGNPRCLYKIGKYLIEGKHNFDKDEKNGFYLIKKASNYHDMKAKYYCAKLYHTGTGFVNQNFKTSLELLEEVNCSEEKGNFQELQSLIQSIKDEMEGSNCSISEKYQYVKNRIMVMENLPKRTEEIEIRNTLSDYQIEAIDFITTGATSTGKKAYIIFYDEETLKEAFQNPYKIGKNTIKISLFKNKPCFKFKKSPKNKVKVKSSNLSKTINPKSSSNSSAQIPPEIDVSLITLPDGEKNYPFIGEGSYAVVFRAQYKGKTVAVKVTKDKFNSIEDKQKTLNYFRREVACLRVLNHPAVIKFYGHSYHNDIFGTNRNTLVMEYAPNSTLQNAIKMAQKGRPMKGWSNTKICNIIIGIANGMKTVHSAKILNRDLKPENILLDVNLYPKICDFGVAKTFDPNSDLNMTLLVGSPAYTAPEILDGSSRWYKKEADVYSFGIILYQLIVLESRPFANIRNVYQLSQYLNKNKRLNIPDSVHPFWKEMINNCWSGVISKRPTFSNIYESICNYLQTPENPPLFPDLNMEEVNAYINLLSANENKPTKTMSKSYQAGQLEKI